MKPPIASSKPEAHKVLHTKHSDQYPPFEWIVYDDIDGAMLAAFPDVLSAADYVNYLRQNINKEKI
ncbi:hypothetical protein [Ralstonia pseudosolanacearum]